jgi:hypothetical protein
LKEATAEQRQIEAPFSPVHRSAAGAADTSAE